jgi:ATP-binding cassette subfamily B protein
MGEPALLSETPPLQGVLRHSRPHLRPHRARIAGALITSAAATASLVLVPAAIGAATDAVLTGDARALWFAVGAVCALALARLVLLRAAEIQLVAVGERVVHHLRDLVVARLAAAPLRFLEAHRGGDLLRRATGEIADLATFLRSQLPDVLSAFGYLGFSVVLLAFYSWQLLLLLAVVFAPMATLITRAFERAAGPAFSAESATQATVAATYRETLEARETLQIAGAQDEWLDRFRRDNQAYQSATRATQVALRRVMLMQIAQGITVAVLLVAGGWLVAAGSISVGTVVVFVVASRELFMLTGDLAHLVGDLQTSRVGTARLLDLLAGTEPPAAGDGRLPERGDLVVEHASYAYGTGPAAVHAVTARFPAGSRTAVVGGTGSGKTTLAKVLVGLYAPDAGAVRFAGTDLAAADPAEVRRRIVLVPQEVHLMTGTLRHNLAVVPGAPDRDRIGRAIDHLGLRDWVDALGTGAATGLDAELGRRGEGLSAGERQLVGLLRAALVDPAVLVLDEATADLDPAAAARLENAIDRMRDGRTLVVIAHRPETIARLPAVVRLAAGRVVPA